MGVRGILLCGGRSSRFGADKLLASLRGEPLAALSARHLVEGVGDALAVIPPGRAELRSALERSGCEILESPDSDRGLGASLAAAVRASGAPSAWIVALGDMPAIRPATITLVRSRLEQGALICAPRLRASGARGHPVGFSAALRDELLELDGDEGARSVIQRHRERVVLVDVDDPGIVIDIDNPQDLVTAERTGPF